MGSDIALTDANYFTDGRNPNRTRTRQSWGDKPHGPVYVVRRVEDALVTRAWCYSCHWEGPNRSGDLNSHRLAEDDAIWHYHQVGVRCGSCERCASDGALRRG